MGYENAPATKMLATHCSVCARPLVDAISVDLGIGPDCRKKYGYGDPCTPEAREEANRLVHEVACKQVGYDVLEAVWRLGALGFEKLAARIMERAAQVRIVETDRAFQVFVDYNADATDAWRRVPGRRWDKEAKCNVIPLHAKGALWRVLKAHYAGAYGVGPKGPFLVPFAATRAPARNTTAEEVA